MAQPSTETPPEAQAFRFRGNASEYFRIWIVNLCLSVVTLGLYAPWAKVRTRRYFAGNLVVGDSAFDYDADPKRILIGRLILLAGLGLYTLADLLFKPISAALGTVLGLLYPAAAIRSTAFHHRHTLFRGIRFGFAASYGEAFHTLVIAPFLATVSLGAALPWLYARRQQFVVKNSRYGASPFAFDGRVSAYYAAIARASLVGLAGLVASGALFGLLGGLAQEQDPIRRGVVFAIIALPALCALGAAVAVAQAGLSNLMYRNASIGDLRIRSELRAGPLAWLYVSSGIAVLLSLGLLTPWARVRIMRYRAGALSLVAPSGLDAFVQGALPEEGVGALASEAADFFDFDLGL